MTDIALKRPHFTDPPIHEQVLSLSFERLRGFDALDPGLFWKALEKDFPAVETRPRMSSPTELFEDSEGEIRFEVSSAIQLPRTIFKNEERGELIQLQDDIFTFNWIHSGANIEYPRFENTSERLWHFFEIFKEYLNARHGFEPVLRQCEMTNINLVPVASFGRDFGDIAEAFNVDPLDWHVPGLVAETYVRRRQHRMIDGEGKPIGRLHSVISPATDGEGREVFQFELTARSAPKIREEREAKEFFDRAHEMINGAFMASVTPKMRKYWGESNGQ